MLRTFRHGKWAGGKAAATLCRGMPPCCAATLPGWGGARGETASCKSKVLPHSCRAHQDGTREPLPSRFRCRRATACVSGQAPFVTAAPRTPSVAGLRAIQAVLLLLLLDANVGPVIAGRVA